MGARIPQALVTGPSLLRLLTREASWRCASAVCNDVWKAGTAFAMGDGKGAEKDCIIMRATLV